MDRDNVDTDQIIPKQFLKRIERTGFGEFLFYDWRRSGGEQPFVLDDLKYKGSSILVTPVSVPLQDCHEVRDFYFHDFVKLYTCQSII